MPDCGYYRTRGMRSYLARHGAFEYEMQLVVAWNKDTHAHMDQVRAFLIREGYDPHHSPVSLPGWVVVVGGVDHLETSVGLPITRGGPPPPFTGPKLRTLASRPATYSPRPTHALTTVLPVPRAGCLPEYVLFVRPAQSQVSSGGEQLLGHLFEGGDHVERPNPLVVGAFQTWYHPAQAVHVGKFFTE